MDRGPDDRDLTDGPPAEPSPPPPAGGGEPPEEPPPPEAPPFVAPPPPGPGRAGIPWEDRDRIGWGPALINTIKLSLFEPTRFFSHLPPRGPEPPPAFGAVGSPILYAIIVGVPAAIAAIFWQFILSSLGILAGSDAGEEVMSIGVTIFAAALTPILIPIGLLVTSVIIHLFLMLVGAAKEGFIATFRTLCYASAPELFQLVPLCGGVVSGIWWLVIAVIGLKEVHTSTIPRALAAVLLPGFVCCGIAMYLALLAGILGYLGLHG